MYSDKKNILQLASLLEAHGVGDIVLCPGSRNAPIVHTLSQVSAFHCYQETDERNAGFMALGMSVATGKATAVCCTSGSALVNLHPAVVEAYYQRVPLIVISADRPACWIGQQDGQTLPQPGVFGPMVKFMASLPEVRSGEDEWYCNRLINEALLTATHGHPGPVHINVPISEPLYRFTVDKLPDVRVIRRAGQPTDLLKVMKTTSRRMIISGQCSKKEQYDFSLITNLPNHFVLLGEHLANLSLKSSFISNFDPILENASPEELESLRPELLVTYGGHIVSGRLKKFLRRYPPQYHWHISAEGDVTDTFRCLTCVCENRPTPFFNKLDLDLMYTGNYIFKTTSYIQLWNERSATAPLPAPDYFPRSVTGDVVTRLPGNSNLHLGNSSVVRYAQQYPLPPDRTLEVHCNRGVNGIEGSLPAAVGTALVSFPFPTFLLIGDLSFFYGMNALCRDVPPNLRILLLNDFGGRIFRTLKGMPEGESRRFIMGQHDVTAKAWAVERGFRYIAVHNRGEWEKACRLFVSSRRLTKPMLVEVFFD